MGESHKDAAIEELTPADRNDAAIVAGALGLEVFSLKVTTEHGAKEIILLPDEDIPHAS